MLKVKIDSDRTRLESRKILFSNIVTEVNCTVGASKLYQRSKIEPSGAGISIFLRRYLYRVHMPHASTYHKILSQTRRYPVTTTPETARLLQTAH